MALIRASLGRLMRHSLLPGQLPTRLGLCSGGGMPDDTAVLKRIGQLVEEDKVVIFMKGTPVEPRCGFSNAVVRVLEMHGVEKYKAHDVLEDEHLRNGIKKYSDWPTIPQVYLNGQFVGGCDIFIDMHKSGELVGELEKLGIQSALKE